MAGTITTDAGLARILTEARSFAVVGASADPSRPSYGVMEFLIAEGYEVVPVNPTLAGQEILGRKVYARLADVPGPVHVVDIFRRSEAVPEIVREAIAETKRLGIKGIWMQLGVVSEEAAKLAQAAKLKVVMDRCPKIEIRRLGSAVGQRATGSGQRKAKLAARRPARKGSRQ
jgi:hypothetical protein